MRIPKTSSLGIKRLCKAESRSLSVKYQAHRPRHLNHYQTSPNINNMSQYLPPTYQQPVPDSRSRASSNASMNRYVPQPPPGPPPAPGGYSGPSRARGPSLGNQQVPAMPPMVQTGSYGPPPVAIPPQNQLHPGYPDAPPNQPQQHPPPNVDRDGYMRPPSGSRRQSVSSTHSRHSQRSHQSHRSHRSRDSRRSHHSSRSADARSRDRRSSELDREPDRRHSYSDERDLKPPKRVKSHRPSWGDTLFGMFDVIKDALGPRDKY